MEDGDLELKRARRRRLTTNAINRQKRIAKQAWNAEHLLKQPHRFAKHHALNCRRPRCIICGNPRRTFKEKTLQEKKFIEAFMSSKGTLSDWIYENE